ncbi:M14 family metallopeptidase [Candidatus Riflebacteria bacterium]
MKNKVFILFFGLFFFGVILESKESLVKLTFKNSFELQNLVDRGYDIPYVGNGFCHVVTDEVGLLELKNKSFSLKILVDDLAEEVSAIVSKEDLGEYYTYEEVVTELKRLESENPQIVSVLELGKTHEDRTIYAVKISDNAREREEETRIFVGGGIHSREWISIQMIMHIIHKLVNGYADDEEIRFLIDNQEIYLVPVLNPDGVVYSQTQYKMWRKNRREMDQYFGVDCNRNFGYHWGESGASNWPGASTFRGPEAFSEPVNQVIKSLEELVNFDTALTFHSYSELILFPWGYTSNNCPDYSTFDNLARAMAEFNNYKPQPASSLYICSGVSMDWLYGARGIYTFTFELARSFIPPENEIAEIMASNWPACLYFFKKSLSLPPSNQESKLSDNMFSKSLDFLLRTHQSIRYLEKLPSMKGVSQKDLLNLKDAFCKHLRQLSKLVFKQSESFAKAKENFLSSPTFRGDRIGIIRALERNQRFNKIFR